MNNQPSFEEAQALFHNYEIALDREKYENLATYAEMIQQESANQNITAVKELREIWIRHFLDSAFMIRFLPKDTAFTLLDIGTGGGIPGIPIAIFCDKAKVTLLDSELRKIQFCETVCKALHLQAECIAGRAEEIAKLSAHREQFDFVISRAMTNGSVLCEMSVPFLKVGGKLFSMKGRTFDDAVERFSPACQVLGCDAPIVTEYEIEGEPKNLITVSKIRNTEEKYPRRFAKIKRNPL